MPFVVHYFMDFKQWTSRKGQVIIRQSSNSSPNQLEQFIISYIKRNSLRTRTPDRRFHLKPRLLDRI